MEECNTDFSLFTVKPALVKEFFPISKHFEVSKHSFRKHVIRTIVNTNGVDVSPKGSVVNTKYLVLLQVPRKVWCDINMAIALIYFEFKHKRVWIVVQPVLNGQI